MSRAARLSKLVELVTDNQIANQSDLVTLLGQNGFMVTQATLSRDLDALGAIKIQAAKGHSYYAIPSDGTGVVMTKDTNRLRSALTEFAANIDYSGNIVVIRTPPGAASLLASAIDRSGLHSILGTIAGDDTVLTISRDATGGQALAEELIAMAGLQMHAVAR